MIYDIYDLIWIVIYGNIMVFSCILVIALVFGPALLLINLIINKLAIKTEIKPLTPDQERNWLLAWIGAGIWFR